MTSSNKKPQNPDDLLAEFADRVLEEEAAVPAAAADPEVRSLLATVQRLGRVARAEDPDQKTVGRMQADLKQRLSRSRSDTGHAWQSQQTRQRLSLTFASVAVFAVILLAIPILLSGNGGTEATAGIQTQGALVLVGIGCMIAMVFWLRRRK
ncbi:MAG TPA: hypothetical protein VGJ22_11070 [Anaerolineales bacterium]|jgi:hypothetical protein